MLTLGERIRYIRDNILHLNQADFAKKLGFSRVATISDYEKNKRSPDITSLRNIAASGGVTLEWLLSGKGPTAIYDVQSSNEAKGAKGESGEACADDFVEVKVYDKAFPGGSEPIDSILIPRKDSEAGHIAFRVSGDGMSPTILDGATVGVNRKDRRLVSGGLYAVWYNYEGVTVKRLFTCPDGIVLKHDNPAFPETTIPSNSLCEDFIVGRIAWLYQRF
ncbi:MAG: XRE family transcriptional regulator [Thermodesulfobacteriota bacterium]